MLFLFVRTLSQVYQPLIYPYPSYGFKSSWDQATNNNLGKLQVGRTFTHINETLRWANQA